MFATPAYAQAAGAASDAGAAGSILSFAPLVLIFVAFYFLMIRPQSKRVKELQASVAAVKKGDEVTTAGGIVGKLTKVEARVVQVETDNVVKVKIVQIGSASCGGRVCEYV